LTFCAGQATNIAPTGDVATRRRTVFVVGVLLPVPLLFYVRLHLPHLAFVCIKVVPHMRDNAADIAMVAFDLFWYEVGRHGMRAEQDKGIAWPLDMKP
jgi:hypothetical protein